MKKICLIFGTRPEAIKMVPVYITLKEQNMFRVELVVTGQHKEMLYQVLDFFKIKPDADISVMKPNQDLFDITTTILTRLKIVLAERKPDLVLVHGDTTTTFTASLASYYLKIPVGHVEAGLRTYNKYSPFPEELNRSLTGRLADIHFAPTEASKQNLINEGIDSNKIVVTGNTVIDALMLGLKKINSDKVIDEIISSNKDKKVILITGHRRENHGSGFDRICEAIKLISTRDDVHIIYPVHLNPNVKHKVYDKLENEENITLIKPLCYQSFIYLMSKANIILTDSGGIQEEAPSLGIPVLVMRDTTERPEAIEAGTAKLVGTSTQTIVSEVNKLLDNQDYYISMSKKQNPYGDGKASLKIKNAIKSLESDGGF